MNERAKKLNGLNRYISYKLQTLHETKVGALFNHLAIYCSDRRMGYEPVVHPADQAVTSLLVSRPT
jgi:hypothetical protein